MPQDLVAAPAWYGLAASAGDEAARSQLEAPARTMTAEQLAEAERRARERGLPR